MMKDTARTDVARLDNTGIGLEVKLLGLIEETVEQAFQSN